MVLELVYRAREVNSWDLPVSSAIFRVGTVNFRKYWLHPLIARQGLPELLQLICSVEGETKRNSRPEGMRGGAGADT